MKAFLLAAGFGSRLRPITDSMPKCMVPIKEKPLLGWWFALLQSHSITDVLVNTHYLPNAVRDYISENNSRSTGLTAHEFFEEKLLGSGGTVAVNRDFIGDDDSFLICYADNLTDIDLSELIEFHNSHDGLLTMALFRTNKPEQCGIATIDEMGKITEFEEKPEKPKSNLANAGIYVARRKIFDYFPEMDFIDFGKDILPGIVGKMYGYKIKDYLLDIGTLDNYEKAQKEWKYDNF